ncbi:MAG: hypothetical protein LUC27_09230 [Lachnospiraceae bacterium]|nr:hypothetical protein [Lachnospiraceae bacterium]
MLHIIANPYSGHGALITAEFCRRLQKTSIPYCLHTTGGKGHARTLAASLDLDENDLLLLIGGDGSLNDTVNGLSLERIPTLLLLPTGSGNDFARGLRMKRSMPAMLSLLQHAGKLTPCDLDCGEVRILSRQGSPAGPGSRKSLSRRFMVSCGMGYDAGVCHAINNSPLKTLCNRLHLGKAAYLILGIRQIFRYKKASVTLTLDDGKTETYENVAFLSFHNLPYEGGGFPFAPRANARDGKLELCLITAKSRLAFTLTLAVSLLGGKHALLPNTRIVSCREAHVCSDIPLPFHTDGEVTLQVPEFSVRCLAKKIPLLYEAGPD